MKQLMQLFILFISLLSGVNCLAMNKEVDKKEKFLNELQKDGNMFISKVENQNDFQQVAVEKPKKLINALYKLFNSIPNGSLFFSDEGLSSYLHHVAINGLQNFLFNKLFYTNPKNELIEVVNRFSSIETFRNDLIKLFRYQKNSYSIQFGEVGYNRSILINYVREHLISLFSKNVYESMIAEISENEANKSVINPMRQARAFGLLRKYLYWYKKTGRFDRTIQFDFLRRGVIMDSMIAFVNAAQEAQRHDKDFKKFDNSTLLKKFIWRALYNNGSTDEQKTNDLAEYLIGQIHHFYYRWWHQYRWSSYASIFGLVAGIALAIKYRDKFKKGRLMNNTTDSGLKEIQSETLVALPVVEQKPRIEIEPINIEEKVDIQIGKTGDNVGQHFQTKEIIESSWWDIMRSGANKAKSFFQDIMNRGGSSEGVERRTLPPLYR